MASTTAVSPELSRGPRSLTTIGRIDPAAIEEGRLAGGFLADPASLTGAAATLHDLAHDLQAGQFDLFLLDWAGDPASHPDVARAMRMFSEFAHDQYQDVVALLAALSTRVKDAADGYQQADDAAARDMTRFLTESTFRPADQRTK